MTNGGSLDLLCRGGATPCFGITAGTVTFFAIFRFAYTFLAAGWSLSGYRTTRGGFIPGNLATTTSLCSLASNDFFILLTGTFAFLACCCAMNGSFHPHQGTDKREITQTTGAVFVTLTGNLRIR